MVQDFLNPHKGSVRAEFPNETTLQLLEKMGLIKKVREDQYESISRLGNPEHDYLSLHDDSSY